MWRPEFRRLPQIVAGIISRSGTIIWRATKKFTVVQQPRFRRPLLISSGIMGITAIIALGFIGLFNYTPDISVPFPYVPPPGSNYYYIEATTDQLLDAFFSVYADPATVAREYIGQGFIFKGILVDKALLNRLHKTYFIVGQIQFVFQYPSELQKLKEGDTIDIIGVCMGPSPEYSLVVVSNCRFLLTGVAPLPLPGGPAPVVGVGY